ncbi:MAG: phage tail protein [Shewanella sp.]
MINLLATNVQTEVANATAMLAGHRKFLKKNEGITNNAQLDHYVQNPEGVLSNNRHFIAASQMEAQPNGDGTTEGQSLHILGHCYAYMATGDQRYLDDAIRYWEAYVQYFYKGQAIPETAQRWICNWIVNAKEPVLSNWPIDPVSPTHSGFKGVEFNVVNGYIDIPHGDPHWGQFLDKATFAFRGFLGWDAINASVKGQKPDGTVDWGSDGEVHDVDWIINWEGKKIDWDGNVLSTGHTEAEKGKVKLKTTGLNGVYKFNYATRQPVEHGGRYIGRNEVQHNRPLHVPLLGSVNQMGNAADAEEWFMDACYLLWKLTNQDRFKKALDSCSYTAHEYRLIDSRDKFFRRTTGAESPFTDGISYAYQYPSNVPITYSRDSEGYITIQSDSAVTSYLEQQSIWFRVEPTSVIRTSVGGRGKGGQPLNCIAHIQVSPTKSDDDVQEWRVELVSPASNQVMVYDIPVTHFFKEKKSDGSPYLIASLSNVEHSSDIISTEAVEENILGQGRRGNVVTSFFPNDDGWYDITFDDPTVPMSITYRADTDFNLRFSDVDNWSWWWMLPATNGQWATVNITPQTGTLSYYQPDHSGSETKPSAPNIGPKAYVSILLDNSSDTNATFSYYCVNELPAAFDGNGWTMMYRLEIGTKDPAGLNARVGDCTVLNYRLDSLNYTPGIIPFSNIYEEGSDQIGAWHGMPYPGYQYPFIYCLDYDRFQTEMDNMVTFLHDSQMWYESQFGELGPCASAYIWDRWDNIKYGPPNTFTMYHWGDGIAWSGYQPRAFQGGCRAWQELVYRNKPLPPKLVSFVENWIKWLVVFVDKSKVTHGRPIFPTNFPPNGVSEPDPTDFTGHMSGLWLAGMCQAYMAGCRVDGMEQLIEDCVSELRYHYVVTEVPDHVMNGAWSSGLRMNTGNGPENNGMFFGFWAGEIMRGLGMYILYKTWDHSKPLYSVSESDSYPDIV